MEKQQTSEQEDKFQENEREKCNLQVWIAKGGINQGIMEQINNLRERTLQLLEAEVEGSKFDESKELRTTWEGKIWKTMCTNVKDNRPSF